MTSLTKSSAQSGAPVANKVLKLHHHAYRTEDIEATRHFYEDVLGMPLVGTFVETWDDVNNHETNYIHAYFELADGSCLAFFSFAKGFYAPSKIANGGTEPTDPFDHHIACEVDGIDTINEIEQRVIAAGIKYFKIDHGYCYSLYMIDPNNMHFELTSKVAKTAEIMSEQRLSARQALTNWLSGNKSGNNAWRGRGT